MGFARWMANPAGRGLRVVAGLGLIAWGLFGGAGGVVAGLGLVPLLAGLLDWCVLAPLFGGPFQGAQARRG